MNQLTGYRYRSTIHKSKASVVSRAVREFDGLNVIIRDSKAARSGTYGTRSFPQGTRHPQPDRV